MRAKNRREAKLEEDCPQLIRVTREDVKTSDRNTVLSAFEKLGARGISMEEQVTGDENERLWTISGEFIGTAVPISTS
jgi:hypothetical protein